MLYEYLIILKGVFFNLLQLIIFKVHIHFGHTSFNCLGLIIFRIKVDKVNFFFVHLTLFVVYSEELNCSKLYNPFNTHIIHDAKTAKPIFYFK